MTTAKLPDAVRMPLWFVCLLAIVAILVNSAAAAAQVGTEASTLRARPFVPDLAAIKRAGPAAAASAAASAPGTAAVQPATASLHLDLFPDTAVEIDIDRRESAGPDAIALVGRVAGDPLSAAYLVVDGDAVAADIVLGGARYEVRMTTGGAHVVRQVDPDAAFDCGTTFDDRADDRLARGARAAAAIEAPASDSGAAATVDLMVLYTPAAEAGAGGAAGMRSTIALAVVKANDALQRSGVPHRFALVHTARTAYVESGRMGTDLSRLTLSGDGQMEEVFALSESVRADVVTLVVEEADHSGLANVMYMFNQDTSVYHLWNTVIRGALSNSLPHELGHNAGLLHDRDNAVNRTPILPYAFGYRIPGQWATMMSYTNCTGGICPRIPYFSNPEVSYQGTPTGVADFADEARALRQTMPILANEQASCVTIGPAQPQSVPAAGGTMSVQIAAAAASCEWNVEPLPAAAPWLTLSSPASAGGVGSGTVQFTLAPNTAQAARTATVVIAGRSVSVEQAGCACVAQPPIVAPPTEPTPSAPAPSAPSPTDPAPPAGTPQTFTSYLAEGATGNFFSTRIALFNPSTTTAATTLRFSREDGAVLTRTVNVPGRGRMTIVPESIAGLESANFSTAIESTEPVVVDRTMTWDKVGQYGSHAETAVSSASTTWYLAEGATSGDFSLFYLLQNPNTAPVQARITYLRAGGLSPVQRVYTLAPTSRTTIAVDEQGPELANAELSAVITADAPIIVERSMYFSRPGQPFTAGHESAGVTEPSTRWFLAEGATGPFFDLFILLANPQPRAADVAIDYLLSDGRTFTKHYTVPASSRFTISVDNEEIPGVAGRPLDNVAVSSEITSTNGVPILVERTMWWPSPALAPANFWTEAHNSPGTRESGVRWALAEGEVGGPQSAETYILIANTSAYAGQVRVTLGFEDGRTAERVYTLAARSRTNVSVSADFAQAAGRRFGAIVESVDGGASRPPVQIVVERAMYTSPGGVPWAAGTNALATKID